MKINYLEPPTLENDHSRLEPLRMSHFDHLSPVVINNPGILKYSPPKFGTKELLKKYIQDNINLRHKNQKLPFAIFDKQKNRYAGCTSYLNISEINERIEIGSTWIGKSFQRTGLNRSCKSLLFEYAFENLDAKRVELKTDGRNSQSKIAILAIGAKYEGTLRSHTIMSDGYRRDTAYYSILKNEWPEIKTKIFSTFYQNQ